MQLPSRQSSAPLVNLLVDYIPHISSGLVDVKATALLLERVVKRAPDHDIWCAVYDLVSPATPPSTPRVAASSVQDTPFTYGSGAIHNTDEGRKYMDSVIKIEMKDHIYLDLPEFFATFFDSVDGLHSLVDAVFARCLQCASYTDTNRWSAFPSSCRETNIIKWFREEVDRIAAFALDADPENVHASALTSRRVVSMLANLLPGSTANRKIDIGFAAENGAGGTCLFANGNIFWFPGS